MDHRRQGSPHPGSPAHSAQPGRRGKKNACSLSAELEATLGVTTRATTCASAAQRLREHLLAALLCPEKATLTNLLCTSGRQQEDWTAAYRLYARERVDESVLFADARDAVLGSLAPSAPLVVAMDDTLIRKRGAHIAGVAWRRDPLGPAFQTNLVRGQRFLQFSAAWPLPEGAARLVPIGFFHTPPAGKPPKEASAAEVQQHKEEQKQRALNCQALQHMQELRAQIEPGRRIIFNGDGSYTNAMLLRKLPEQSTYIGRIRKDAKLHERPAPVAAAATGRRPSYGPLAPTPEELRTDEATPWQTVPAFAAGRRHEFRVKTLGPVLWRKSGAALPLRVVVIAPLGYRLRAGGKLLYRQPAYIICTDPDLPLAELLQDYLWRWGIEVNFRDEKTLLGAGQAQVRTAASNQHLPAVIVAAYALLWTSALRLHRQPATEPSSSSLTPPRWRRHTRDGTPLPSTGDLLRTLRFEHWSRALRPGTFYDFVTTHPSSAKPQKLEPSLPGALFAAA
jgi:hypothetical protein